MTDAALVFRARAGDELAFRRLLTRHRDIINLHASRYFLRGGSPDDLRQEGRIGLHKAVDDYRPNRGSGFRNFADLCIHRQILTAVTAANRQKHSPLNESAELELEDDDGDLREDRLPVDIAADPQQVIGRVVGIRETARSIRSLGLSDLETVSLDMLTEGASYDDIAAELGCSPKSVDNALQRVRRKVGDVLPAA